VPIAGLVRRLDALAARPGARLRVHGPPTPAQRRVMKLVDPDRLPFDPARATYDGAAAGG
jgi:hypothetical protein